MADDLFFGEFQHLGHTYEVIEEDYLIDGIDELDDLDDIIKAAKHAAIQRMAVNGNLAENLSILHHDYQISQDPIDFEGTVLIFDGNNLAWRAKHSYELSYKQWDVSVLYGCLNMISSTVRKFPDVKAIVLCWDGGVPKFRYDCIPTYKRRDHADDEDYQDFIRQLKELQSLASKLGIYSLRQTYTEADDLMYHTSRLIHPDYHKIIVTTDQDLLQAINGHTSVWQPKQEVLVTRDTFQEHTGVAQANFLVYRCMVGDTSDGVPGCKGIGEGTAPKLIRDYGSPSNIINVALGLAPTDKPMAQGIANKLKVFGIKGFADTMAAIRLDTDRCGARLYSWNELRVQRAYDHMAVNNYLKHWAFVSLMSTDFYDCFRNLERPRLVELEGQRFPRVMVDGRQPVA